MIEENKSYNQIIGNKLAPYINSLARRGALLTNSYGIAHPSQPNYLALFSGGTHGVVDNRCDFSVSGENLASLLIKAGYSFRTYSESLPSVGYTGCSSGHYYKKHNPAANWQGRNIPADANLPFTTFHWGYQNLPTVAFVVPNQLNDMHDGSADEAIARGDRWLKDNMAPFVAWAESNDGLLIVTWDEDDGSSNNHIATIFVGPMVRSGTYGAKADHLNLLRTLTEMYGLAPLGGAAAKAPIVDIWRR